MQLTENDNFIELWRNYQAVFVENDITVPVTVSKMYQNKRFKMPMDILPGTGDENDRGKDSNTSENMDNF